MKAMGLPTSFTSSLMERSKPRRQARSRPLSGEQSADEASLESTEDRFKAALDDWLEHWNREGYQLATMTWTSQRRKILIFTTVQMVTIHRIRPMIPSRVFHTNKP